MSRLSMAARVGALALLIVAAESCSSDATRAPTSGVVVASGGRLDALSLSSSNFQQCANGKDGGLPCSWINGVLNDSKSDYREGDVIAERMVIAGLTPGHTYRLAFDWGWEKALNPGHMNYDFLAGWNATLGALAVVCRDQPSNADYAGVCNADATVLADHLGTDSLSAVIPDAIFTTNAPLGLSTELQAAIDRFQTLRGADALRFTILGGGFPANPFDNVTYNVSGDNVTGRFTVRFVAKRTTVMLLWGGHFADGRDYRTALWDDDKNAATPEKTGNLSGAAGQTGAPFQFTQQYIKNLDTGDSTGIGSLSNNVQGSVVQPVPKAKIAIAPSATNGIGESHTFTVTLQKDLDDGAGYVAASGEHVTVTLSGAGGASAVIDAAASTCDDAGANTNASGQCTIKFTSNTAGTVTGSATATLTVGGTSITVSTDASGENSSTAVKTFVAGTLRWLKHDGSAALLGGAVFTVCRTHVWVSATSSYTDVSDVCVDVTDDVSGTDNTNASPADRDGTAGEFELGGLVLGRYTIVEKTAPAGYILDPDPVTVDLSTTTASFTVATPFVNVAPNAFITITPNTATNSTTQAHTFTAVLTAVPNGGSSVTISAIAITVSPTPSTLGTVQCQAQSGNTRTCTLTINSNAAGTFTANASGSVTVDGVTLTRDTDPATTTIPAGPGGSGPATKTYIAPNLVVTKEPDQGDGGSSITPNPTATATFTIGVQNTGQGKAFNVVLTDQLLNTLSWAVDPAVQGCSISNTQLLTCNIGTMNGTVDGGGTGASFSVTVKATVTSSFVLQPPQANGTLLEIDGNVVSNGGLDWATSGFISCQGTLIGCALDLSNTQSDNSLGEGTKEDDAVPTVGTGSIPNNKSDLHRFYIQNNRVNIGTQANPVVHDFLYLAWERVNSPQGTTNMDFEFNQSSQTSANGVTPVRTAGDLLIKYDLSNGGGSLSMGFHRWVTSGACEANGATPPCWGPVQSLAGAFSGQANGGTITDPIPPGSRNLTALTFGEARIDMQLANFFTSIACVNFGRAYLKSRSSDSFTAAIKDFVAPIPISVTNCAPVTIPNTATATADNATTASDNGQITVNVP